MGVSGLGPRGGHPLESTRMNSDPMQNVVYPVLKFNRTDAEGDSDHLGVKLVCAGQVCCNPKTIMGISQYYGTD